MNVGSEKNMTRLSESHGCQKITETSKVTDLHLPHPAVHVADIGTALGLLGIFCHVESSFDVSLAVGKSPYRSCSADDAGLRTNDDHVTSLATALNQIFVIVVFFVLKGVDMRSGVILQGSEYHIIDMLVTETKTRHDQERIVELQETCKSVRKGHVWLLAGFFIFL